VRLSSDLAQAVTLVTVQLESQQAVYFPVVCCNFPQSVQVNAEIKKGKVIPLHAMEALGARGGIVPTHS
jgi:hypothetical protein